MVLPAANPTKSYWIEAAESPLRKFRSTDDLPQEADVVIVGSGYAGASTAYWIHKVCRLELDDIRMSDDRQSTRRRLRRSLE